jgi:CDP-glucose 4,6-dehydratase
MVNPTATFWKRRRVLVTGHTGFKGAWLWQLLQALGAEPTGIGLQPATDPNLSVLTGLPHHPQSRYVDITDRGALTHAVGEMEPEIVFHLAAQSLVRRSYEQPIGTFSTNVMGTIHLLEALRFTASVRCVVVVTSDKVYRDQAQVRAYRETDMLGGHDPYSGSKASSELAVASWRLSFFKPKIPPVGLATARSGNVIGGGDWATDRLIPDLIRAFTKGEAAQIRHPSAIRAWLHVLDPLIGYLLLAERLWHEPDRFDEAWNFGPDESQARSVEAVAREAVKLWGHEAGWRPASGSNPHETTVLRLDAAKAQDRLDWRPRLDFEQTLAWTIDWYRRWGTGAEASDLCNEQIERYLAKVS